MKKSYTKILIAVIVILVIYVSYIILLDAGVIRNYHIKDFVIDVNIDDLGSIHVKEDTVYKFNGEYNGITVTIPTNVSKEYYEELTKDSMNDSKILSDSLYICNEIEDVSIYVVENGKNRYFKEVQSAKKGDSGVYTVSKQDGFTTFTIYEPSVSIDKQIVIEYTLNDIVVQHNDVAELFWNFIGGEVECKIKNFELNINGNNISKAYTHGNMTGKLTNTINGIKITYKNVKPGEFVSARVILDSISDKIVKQNNVTALPIIEEFEDSYLNKKQTMVNLIVIAIIMTIGILIYWVFLLIKYEKEVETVPLVIDDMEILEQYNPMIAACIAQNRGMHPRDILAVLIDLVNVGALKMIHILGYVIGTQQDMYKLTKNEEFFTDKDKLNKLDDIQISVIDIFFGNNNEIELVKRLKEIQADGFSAIRFKELDKTVAYKLEAIGANYQTVPKIIRIFNTVLFIAVLIYVVFMLGYSATLDYIKLSATGSDFWLEVISSTKFIIILIIMALPIVLLLAKLVVNVINVLRIIISKIAFKLSSKKLTRTILVLVIIFLSIFIMEIILIKKSNIIIATILLFSGVLVVLTDNLMTSHNKAIKKQYITLKLLQEKIENGSLLNEKKIQDTILWNRYFTFAVALGIGDVAKYIKYIPDTLGMVDTFNSVTENGFGLYNIERELIIQSKINIFNNRIDSWTSSSLSGWSSGSGGGFSSGGGRHSGGGGRGGGRGAF